MYLLMLCFSMNLYELAQAMVDLGAVNAINLDGGGSATLLVNGTLVNYPSDAW
jgi:N-acetylglucosamine-1-phosphodiester alpha-N-acetylglucosaminidase